MTTPELTKGYLDLTKNHLPNLYKYVIPIAHEDRDSGEEQVGSAVLVNISGRHLIISAKHCLVRNPRVVVDGEFTLFKGKLSPKREVSIIRKECHATLDIGFIEVTTAEGAELSQEQLYVKPILKIEGGIHIIGHPVVKSNFDITNGQPVVITRTAFQTEFIDGDETSFRLKYPKEGIRYDVNLRDWVTEPFIQRPDGFSGGGCFGVRHVSGPLDQIDYLLFGIQVSWHSGKRWVKVIPINQFWNLFNELDGPSRLA